MSPKPSSASRRRAVVIAIAAAVSLPVLVGGVALTLELRQQVVSERIGRYLLHHNAERARRGAIWDVIRGSQQSRLGLMTPRQSTPPPPSRSTGIPDVLLQWTFRVDMDESSIVLESVRRDSALDPGAARGEEIRALASDLRHYRLGEDLLHRVAIDPEPYQRRAEGQFDSLLSRGGLIGVLDGRLRARRAPSLYLLEPMEAREQRRWLERLERWRNRRNDSERSGLAKFLDWRPSFRGPGQQERLYRRLCEDLIEDWADSLYTTDFLRLTDGWSRGGGYSALATRDGESWQGRVVLGNGDVIPFFIPGAEPATLSPDQKLKP